MKKEQKEIKGKIWTTEALVTFGFWLLKRGETGYGLLCIHGPILGMKIGNLLNLRWRDYIDPTTDECYQDLSFEDDKLTTKPYLVGFRELNHFIQRITEFEFNNTGHKEKGFEYDDFVYTKAKTGQVLTTSTLNRELQKFHEEFKSEIYKKTFLDFDFEELKSNAFEIAWARNMVEYYAYSKKAFIAVSKFMGHRTLKHTIEVLGIEPRDEIVFRFDLFQPSIGLQKQLDKIFDDNETLAIYLLSRKFANQTQAYEDAKKR